MNQISLPVDAGILGMSTDDGQLYFFENGKICIAYQGVYHEVYENTLPVDLVMSGKSLIKSEAQQSGNASIKSDDLPVRPVMKGGYIEKPSRLFDVYPFR